MMENETLDLCARTDSVSVPDAESIAIAYASWTSRKTDLDTAVWGRTLLDWQDRYGLDLVDRQNTRKLIQFAERRLHGE